jgi:hypothetical protein
MHAFNKLAVLAVSVLGFASSAFAAPVEAASSDLAARAPYDVHNGWVSTGLGFMRLCMSDYISA